MFRRIKNEKDCPRYITNLLPRNADNRSVTRANRYGMCNLVCPRYNRETEGRGSTFQVRGFKLWNAIHSIRKTPLTPLKLLLKNTF